MRKTLLIAGFLCLFVLAGWPAQAELRAGVSRVSITPLEDKIPTPLGGYGARNGKPAEGIHDTLYAKALVFEYKGAKSAFVTLDVCSLPVGLVEESVSKANIPGLTKDTTLMAASHTHAGLEGFSMDRRNVFDNPHVGVFSEPVLRFVVERIAKLLHDADAGLRPVKAGAGVVSLPGMNGNRRNGPALDDSLTVLRLDTLDGSPYAALVNYTAHGTLVDDGDMLVSGEWPGQMQRTVEACFDDKLTCLYFNGAEGDVSPRGARGASAWERIEDYGRRVGLSAAHVTQAIQTGPVTRYGMRVEWVDLPKRQAAPDFAKIAGEEYHVTDEQLGKMLETLFPVRAPLFALRVNDYQVVTFPGEPMTQLGLDLKNSMRAAGIRFPCVASLTNDCIGYILPPDEYLKSGYEVTASFYGPTLGPALMEKATALAVSMAKAAE